MTRAKGHVPKLSSHKSGAAFVKIAGQFIWLGRYGDPLAQEKYDRLVAEWLASGRRLPGLQDPPACEPITVTALLLAYWSWAKERYTPSELSTIKSALRQTRQLYGSTPAAAFGPNRLRAVRRSMIDRSWSRSHINRQCSRVRSLFKWGAAHEYLPASVYQQLAAVEPLRRGEAKERPRVRPTPRRLIRCARAHLPVELRALIDLQLLTGARADELVRLKATDLNMGEAVWTLDLEKHKTAHHGKGRAIYFGPRAQRVLRVLLAPGSTPGRALDAYLFSPRSAERKRHDTADVHRRPNQKPNPRKTPRMLGEHYTTASYRRAIERACDKAFRPPEELKGLERSEWRRSHRFSPHQLRHNAATFLRRQFGIDLARTILGHSSLTTTAIYAEADTARAIEAMARVG